MEHREKAVLGLLTLAYFGSGRLYWLELGAQLGTSLDMFIQTARHVE